MDNIMALPIPIATERIHDEVYCLRPEIRPVLSEILERASCSFAGIMSWCDPFRRDFTRFRVFTSQLNIFVAGEII